MTAASRPTQPPVAPLAPAEDFDAVYDSYFGFVWRCLRGLGVAAGALDDAAQDVFLVVHRRLPTFRAESSVRTWLYGIVRNVASNHRRSRKRRPEPVALDVELPSRRLGPEDALVEQESLRFVQQFLESLGGRITRIRGPHALSRRARVGARHSELKPGRDLAL